MRAEDFIAGPPKAELRLHVGGTREPEMVFALAARKGRSARVAEIDAYAASAG